MLISQTAIFWYFCQMCQFFIDTFIKVFISCDCHLYFCLTLQIFSFTHILIFNRLTILQAAKALPNTTVSFHAQVVDIGEIEENKNRSGQKMNFYKMTVAQYKVIHGDRLQLKNSSKAGASYKFSDVSIKGSSDPFSQIRRERSYDTMEYEDVPKSHQPKARVHLIPSK